MDNNNAVDAALVPPPPPIIVRVRNPSATAAAAAATATTTKDTLPLSEHEKKRMVTMSEAMGKLPKEERSNYIKNAKPPALHTGKDKPVNFTVYFSLLVGYLVLVSTPAVIMILGMVDDSNDSAMQDAANFIIYSTIVAGLGTTKNRFVQGIMIGDGMGLLKKIRRAFNRDTTQSKAILTNQFAKLQQQRDESLEDYIARTETLFAKLESIGKIYPDDERNSQFLFGLNSKFAMLEAAIFNGSYVADEWETMLEHVRDMWSYMQRKSKRGEEDSDYEDEPEPGGDSVKAHAAAQDTLYGKFCTWCGLKNHPSAACWYKKTDNYDDDSSGDGRQFVGSESFSGCYKCGEKDHLARDCETTREDRKESNNKSDDDPDDTAPDKEKAKRASVFGEIVVEASARVAQQTCDDTDTFENIDENARENVQGAIDAHDANEITTIEAKANETMCHDMNKQGKKTNLTVVGTLWILIYFIVACSVGWCMLNCNAPSDSTAKTWASGSSHEIVEDTNFNFKNDTNGMNDAPRSRFIADPFDLFPTPEADEQGECAWHEVKQNQNKIDEYADDESDDWIDYAMETYRALRTAREQNEMTTKEVNEHVGSTVLFTLISSYDDMG